MPITRQLWDCHVLDKIYVAELSLYMPYSRVAMLLTRSKPRPKVDNIAGTEQDEKSRSSVFWRLSGRLFDIQRLGPIGSGVSVHAQPAQRPPSVASPHAYPSNPDWAASIIELVFDLPPATALFGLCQSTGVLHALTLDLNRCPDICCWYGSVGGNIGYLRCRRAGRGKQLILHGGWPEF